MYKGSIRFQQSKNSVKGLCVKLKQSSNLNLQSFRDNRLPNSFNNSSPLTLTSLISLVSTKVLMMIPFNNKHDDNTCSRYLISSLLLVIHTDKYLSFGQNFAIFCNKVGSTCSFLNVPCKNKLRSCPSDLATKFSATFK